VTPKACLATDHDVIFQKRATGSANLCHDHAAATNAYFVPDPHRIVETRAGTDIGIMQRAMIDRGARANRLRAASDGSSGARRRLAANLPTRNVKRFNFNDAAAV
jgi:hypothetical protein